MQAYQQMLLKGMQALQQTNVKSANEAGQLIDKAIKGIEAIHHDSFQVSFLKDVGMLLKNEIHDRDLLSRMAEGLDTILEKYCHNTIRLTSLNNHYSV